MKSVVAILIAALALIVMGLFVTWSDPSQPTSANPKALSLCLAGTEDLYAFRFRSAVDKLGQCLTLDPSLAEAAIARTRALDSLGEHQAHARELVRADSLTALLTDEHRRMVAELRLSFYPKSRFYGLNDSLMTRLESEMPDNIHVLVALAERARRRGDDSSYEQALLKILGVNPNYANSYNLLGYMELSRGNYKKAIEHMQKYAFLAPGLANPHDSLGEVYLALGRYEDAELEFTTAVRMQPDFYHSLINLGKTYLARGQLQRGLEILEMVRAPVKGSGLEQRVDRELVTTYLTAGLNDKLLPMMAQYVSNYPEDHLAILLDAIRLASRGEIERGKAMTDSALAAWQQEARSTSAKRRIINAGHQFAAFAADAAGDPSAGVSHWRLTLYDDNAGPVQTDPKLWYLHYRLARDLFLLGQTEAALAEIDPWLAVNPRRINMLILKVECHLERHEKRAATAALKQLQWSLNKADPDFPARHQADALASRVANLTPSP